MEGPDPQTKSPPPRRRYKRVVFAMMALSCSVVLGPVLLSNDMRHLRALAHRFGFDFPPAEQEMPVPVPAPKPAAPRSVLIARFVLSPHLLEAPDPKAAAGFLRRWRISAPEMCATLRSAGVDISGWKPSEAGAGIFECAFEKIYRQDGETILSSLYLVVRGASDGTIANLRLKLVDPPVINARLDMAISSLVRTMLDRLNWFDTDRLMTAIDALQPFEEDGFGADIAFAAEFTSDRNFNLTITLRPTTDAEKRAQAFFSGSLWRLPPAPRKD